MTDFLDEIMSEVDAVASTSDKLDILKKTAAQLRFLELKKEELEQELAETKKAITLLSERDLVQLFSETNLSSLTLDADGNYPAMKFDKTTFYNAKIPEEKEAEAFAWLHDNGHADIVKTEIKLSFGMRERQQAERLEKALAAKNYDYNTKLGVHPATLKAFAKSEIEAGHALPMDVLGIYVGEIVRRRS